MKKRSCKGVVMEKKIPDGLLMLHEELLKAQLQAIRRLRGTREERAPREGRSHMSIVMDLLTSAGEPLHVSEIIRRAQERFDMALDRESLVSALVKKVRAGILERTAPNTFYSRKK
jgi:hypothetical protein